MSAFVGKGVEFKGTITYNGTVRIEGFLDGEIHTEGVLLVDEETVITAKVTAGTIVCKGKITGGNPRERENQAPGSCRHQRRSEDADVIH